MVDPDAPDREGDGSSAAKFGPWNHWVVTNTTSDSLGTPLVPYMGPAVLILQKVIIDISLFFFKDLLLLATLIGKSGTLLNFFRKIQIGWKLFTRN